MERLKQRADFLAAATGARAPGAAFVLQTRQRPEAGPVRVGFTVSKKVGNAVERNRVRRRLREMVRLSATGPLQAGYDYVLIGRRVALEWPFQRLMQEFDKALHRIHAETQHRSLAAAHNKAPSGQGATRGTGDALDGPLHDLGRRQPRR